MGSTYSFMNQEKKTWINHTLEFDAGVREANLKLLDSFKDGVSLYISYSLRNSGNIQFQHWFITDRIHFLEFGAADLDIYSARVTINSLPRTGYPCNDKDKKSCTTMNGEIRERMRAVLGMNNYSLCFRNCEHVANYIFSGHWVSSQMDSHEPCLLLRHFRANMQGDPARIVNSPPEQLRMAMQCSRKKMYGFLKDHYIFTGHSYYLDAEEDTYNVLVFGPTGAGKSHLINVFFNQNVCPSEVSHRSVTREMYFIRGRGNVYSVERKEYLERKVIVADTIGLCDTELKDSTVVNLIKNRVSANFKYIDAVYVVFQAGRLGKEHVENIITLLSWLGYYTRPKAQLRFSFVGTFADNLTEQRKQMLREEARHIFKLYGTKYTDTSRADKTKVETLIYTGFPPEDALNDTGKQRVLESWRNVSPLLKLPGNTERLSVGTYRSCVIL